MDVTCEQCGTRYDFDDALVSERGTTVKCTQCHNEFRVRRSSKAVSSWTVLAADGRELVFEAMRHLQAAIMDGTITPEAMLIPDEGQPRQLGDISELSSFFQRQPPSMRAQHSTQPGVGATPPPRATALTDRDGEPLPARTGDTLQPPADMGASAFTGRASISTIPPPLPPPSRSTPPPRMAAPPPPSVNREPSHSDEEPTEPAAQRISLSDDDPTPIAPDDEIPRSTKPLQSKAGPPPSARDEKDTEPEERSNPDDTLSEPGFIPEAERSSSPDDTLSEPALDIESVPDSAPTPASEPAPDSAPTPASEPAPDSAPTPASEPAPDSKPHNDDITTDTIQPFDAAVDSGVQSPRAKVLTNPPISSLPPLTPSPSIVRPSVLRRSESHTQPRFTAYGPHSRKPTFARMAVGLILVGLITVIGFTVLSRYKAPKSATAPTAAPNPNDARVSALVNKGQELLLDGDIESAKEQFDKASALAENDPRVAQALAQIAVVRADTPWLHLRLLPTGASSDERDAIGQRLSRATTRVVKAIEQLESASPNGASGTALKLDLFRLQDRLNQARALVPKLEKGKLANEQSLAILDLSETSFDEATVIARLRDATRRESKLGHARPILVYVLAHTGRKKLAETELASFASHHPHHPLLTALKAFVAQAKQKKDKDKIDDGELSAADKASGNEIPADFRTALQFAHNARRAGKLGRAQQLFQAALDKNPGNSEALTGLADIARANGNSTKAAKHYQSILSKNPGYVPALIALADIRWASGSRAEAVSLYRRIVQSAPDSSYAARARHRITQAETPRSHDTADKPSTDKGTGAEPKSPPTEPHPPTGIPEGVDLSDLPEYQ